MGYFSHQTKTEAVLFGTRFQRDKIPTASGIDVAGTVVPFRDSQAAGCDTLHGSDDGPACY